MTLKSMKRTMAIIVSSVLLCCLFIICGSKAWSGDKKLLKEPLTPVFVSISTDDILDADAAVHFVEQVAKRGHQVSILLNSRGVRLALANVAKPIYGKQNKSIQDRLQALIQDGVKVIVCFGQATYDGRKKADLIDGVTIGSADIVMPALFEKHTKVISW